MRLKRTISILLAVAVVTVSVAAQESQGETFVYRLTEQLSELGWSEEAVAQFRNASTGMDWSPARHADPEMLAWALEFGMPEDALSTRERAQLALALATHTAEMARVGFSNQDIASAAMRATRATAERVSQSRTESGNPDVGEMIRTRIGDSIQEQTRTATRVRSGNADGNGYRIGESDPGVPVDPDDPPRPGSPANPDTPGDGTPSGPRN